jgi:hypothetical protein
MSLICRMSCSSTGIVPVPSSDRRIAPMVCTRIPRSRAASAASSGVICPLLFWPSVRTIATFDFAVDARRTFSPFARPMPIAVPPLTRPPVSRGSTSRWTAGWSSVRGARSSPSPAKMTRPTRSFLSPWRNSMTTFFTASIFGVPPKPASAIEPETSRTMAMSMPSAASSDARIVCGRARAAMRRTSETTRRVTSSGRRRTRQLR